MPTAAATAADHTVQDHHVARGSRGTARPTLRLAFLALALLSALSVAAPARAAEVPDGFFGLGGWSHISDGHSAELGGAGMGVYRASLSWDDVERQPGVRNWAGFDALVDRANRNGFDILLVLNGCTAWACGSAAAPPKHEPVLSQYRQFVAEAVGRYGANGSHWAGGPRPRVMWQVGNEVNGGHYFGKHPQPAEYAAFLRAVGSTVKSVDPTATVVASGLVEKPADADGAFLQPFLAELYRQPGYASSFDVAAVHGYAENPDGTRRVLDVMRRVMLEAGDGGRPLWITEMSWATGGPLHAFRVDEQTQAAHLRASWDTLLPCRSRWNLQKVMWFGYTDIDPATIGSPDYWGVHTGLLRGDGSPKPAYGAFLEYLGGRLPAGRAELCGLPNGTTLDILDPDTSITHSPGITRHVTGPTVGFASNEPGTRFECSMDGVEWWAACGAPHPVDSAREGTHWLRVRAIDPQGNIDPTPARVDWMLDLTPPSTLITSRTPRTTSSNVLKLEFVGRDAIGVAGYECRLDGSAWAPCTSPYQTPKLKPGWHTIGIRTIDKAGHTDPTAVEPKFKILSAKEAAKSKKKCASKKGKAKAKAKRGAKKQSKRCATKKKSKKKSSRRR